MSIIIYTKTGCPWCRGVLDLLNEKKIAYEERNVSENKAYYDEMVRISGQTKAPTLDIDGEILGDSDKDQVGEFLRKEGMIK